MSSGSSPGLLILILLEVLSLLNLSLLLQRKVLEQLRKEALGFGLLFPLLNLVFSALNLFRQSFVFFEVEIEDVKFVHKKLSALFSTRDFRFNADFLRPDLQFDGSLWVQTNMTAAA